MKIIKMETIECSSKECSRTIMATSMVHFVLCLILPTYINFKFSLIYYFSFSNSYNKVGILYFNYIQLYFNYRFRSIQSVFQKHNIRRTLLRHVEKKTFYGC